MVGEDFIERYMKNDEEQTNSQYVTRNIVETKNKYVHTIIWLGLDIVRMRRGGEVRLAAGGGLEHARRGWWAGGGEGGHRRGAAATAAADVGERRR